MLKNLHPITISLVFLLFSMSVFGQQLSSFIIGSRGAQRYNRYMQSSIAVKVYNAVIDKRIPAYKDSALKEKWEVKKLYKSLQYCETIIVNRSVSDPYAASVDSTICTPPEGYTVSNTYVRNVKNRVSAFFFRYDNKINKMGYFVSLSDIKPLLTSEEWCLMEHFSEAQNLKGHIFDFDGLSRFSDSLLLRIGSKLYSTGLSGSIPVYRNDSLITPEPLDILKKIGAYVVNAPTKDGRDSVVITPFSPEEVKGIYVVQESKAEDFTSTFTIKAMGPCYIPYLSGVPLPIQPMFYLRLDKNFMSVLQATDVEYLKGLINFCRLRRIDQYNYMDDHDNYAGSTGEENK